MIVATTRLHRLTLLTKDRAIRDYPHARTLWD
jgi:PIN domain nuclease of toxin-antitoxin system